MTGPLATDLTLEGEKVEKKHTPWGDGVFLSVLFPSQVRCDGDKWVARCRELKIETADFPTEAQALEQLKGMIRSAAKAWAGGRRIV